MIDIKYTFVCNCQDNDLYSLIMSAWYVDTEGNRVTTNSETKFDLTLEESFIEAENFVNNNQTV